MFVYKTKQNQPKTKQTKFCMVRPKHALTVIYGGQKDKTKQTKQNGMVWTIQKNFITKFFYDSNLAILLGCLVLVGREVFKPP